MKSRESISPQLLQQYTSIKNKYPDALLLFRSGDYYDILGEDAIKTNAVLHTLLTLDCTGEDEINSTYFHHTRIEDYLPKLVKAGYRVAICDQQNGALENPRIPQEAIDLFNEIENQYRSIENTKRVQFGRGHGFGDATLNKKENKLANLKQKLAGLGYEHVGRCCGKPSELLTIAARRAEINAYAQSVEIESPDGSKEAHYTQTIIDEHIPSQLKLF